MKRGVVVVVGTVLAVLTMVPEPAGGTIIIRKDLAQICAEAESIVIARVVDQNAAWTADRRVIYTHTTVVVERTLKGKARKRIVISEPGGTVGDVTCIVHGMPQYRIGQRVLVALKRDVLGFERTHGLIQGQFAIVKNLASGEDRVRLRAGLEHVTRAYFAKSEVSRGRTVAFDTFVAKIDELVRRAEAVKKEKK